MNAAAILDPESERLQVLRDYAVLDTPAEPVFDRLVKEAAGLFGAVSAAVTIVADDRCWFKARHGIGVPQVPREQSLCGYAFRSSGVVVVPDAASDDRFRSVPLVRDDGILFYVGAPLLTPEGQSLGTICVLDTVARQPTAIQLECFRAIAGEVVAAMVARRASRRQPPGTVSPAPKRTVLIVDDEESVRTLVRVLVERRGAETIVATDGADALAKLRDHAGEIGAILTDIHMPNMNGLDFIRTLRAENIETPIVVMCGRADDSLLAQLRNEKVACVLHKPFAVAEIEAVIALLPAPAAGS